jgi:hypothetical protein
MRNTADQTSTGIPIFGLFCAACTVLLLVFAAERSGLPIAWSEWFVRIILFFALAATAWLGRSAVERLFLGREPSAAWRGGGLILGIILFAVVRLLPAAQQAELWLPNIFGTFIGITSVHLLLRRQFKRNRLQAPPRSRNVSLVMGVALCLLGGAIGLPSLVRTLTEITPVLSSSSGLAITYVLILSICAVALGGAKGGLAMVAMLTLVALGGILLGVGIGLNAYGAIPLPGFDNPTTLQAIHEVKNSLGLTNLLFLRQWPSFGSLVGLNGLTAMILSALISGAIALTLTPAIEVRRRRVVITACGANIILPLLIMALGGYAIEATAEQLIGTAITNPPAALLEAARLGLVKVCGGFPETAEALRLQCGVAPRDTMLLDTARLQPQINFLMASLPVSLGFTSLISQSVRLFPFALSLAGVVTGIWFIAIGLGRSILGQRHDAPGLASHRIALTRMSAVLAAIVLGILVQFNLAPFAGVISLMGGASAAIILFLQINALLSSIRAPRQTPQTA